MNITIEAVYEAGVFKPLSPVENLKEHDKVRLVVEPAHIDRSPLRGVLLPLFSDAPILIPICT